jgi:hypothetical protein
MSTEEELAFLKTYLDELSPAVSSQLKQDILAEKRRRESVAAAEAKVLGGRPTGQSSWRQSGSAGEETVVSHKTPDPPQARST